MIAQVKTRSLNCTVEMLRVSGDAMMLHISKVLSSITEIMGECTRPSAHNCFPVPTLSFQINSPRYVVRISKRIYVYVLKDFEKKELEKHLVLFLSLFLDLILPIFKESGGEVAHGVALWRPAMGIARYSSSSCSSSQALTNLSCTVGINSELNFLKEPERFYFLISSSSFSL